jgi:hypothetical protein
LVEELVGMLGDREGLRSMGERARGMARPEAVKEIAGMVVGLGKQL